MNKISAPIDARNEIREGFSNRAAEVHNVLEEWQTSDWVNNILDLGFLEL
ncbi:hypothetical protein Hanom_Chr09g00804671 [Helianthus anomalus]